MLAAPLLLSNDLLTGAEWNPPQTRELLQLAADIKAHPGRYASTLRGKFIALIFEKPSLRTRVTFEVGIQSMGGSVIFLDHTQARLGERECISDVARNLERWVQGIVARVYEQRVLEELAANTEIPVINALSDKFHPCQALADFLTHRRKIWLAAWIQARLRRRRQQRLPLADFSGRAPGRASAHRHSAGLRAGAGGVAGSETRGARNARQNRTVHRSARSGSRRARRLHRCVDQHGI